jgi:hypothetical protein
MKLAAIHRQEHPAFHFRIKNNGAATVGANQFTLRNAPVGGLQFPTSAGENMEIEPECRIPRSKPLDYGFRRLEISNVKMHSGIKTERLQSAFPTRSFFQFNRLTACRSPLSVHPEMAVFADFGVGRKYLISG